MSENNTVLKIHSKKLNLDFTVTVQNDTVTTQQKCFVLTIHDIGQDHNQFKKFIDTPNMSELKERIIWVHVDLPGQEENAEDLDLIRYPNLIDLGHELILVLDNLGISQVICFGEGAGANICTNFAIIYPQRCLGVVLIHPTGAHNPINTFVESFKEKMNIRRGSRVSQGSLTSSNQSYLYLHKFGQKGNDSDQFTAMLSCRNKKNLSLYIEAYMNRSSLTEKLNNLTVDVLTVIGKNSSLANESKRFFKALENSRKFNLKSLVNCPFIEVDNVSDVITYSPSKLALSLQFFLQGIGLLSAIPIDKGLKYRKDSFLTMQDADKPRDRRLSCW